VKHNRREAVEFGLTGALSTDIPRRPRFRASNTKIVLLALTAILLGATFGFSPTAKAESGFTIASIDSALPAWSQTSASGEATAISALNSYARQIGTESTKASTEIDGQSYVALRSFAQGLGADKSASLRGQIKVAEADNFLDWLNQPKEAPAPTAKAPKAVKGKKAAVPVEAHFVGDKVCLGCHSTQAAEFQKTLMGRISLTQPGKFSCENCHGPGSAHAKAGGGRGVGGIMSFEDDDPRSSEEKNAICLACHERGQRTMWQGSVHEERNLACVNCHTIMKSVSRKNQLKTAWEPDTCFQCHKDRRAQMFRSSHMPMREGKVVCSDCHNPHGSFTEALLKKDSINDVCYTCHAEKRGPFLFEHEPVRENCDNCHDPHGSINQFSLKVPRPRLCNECHNLMDNTAGPLGSHAVGQACENCHVAIHGSNAPDGQLLFR
jgi:DmsE family decaheme c-type cytochrome